MYVMLYIYMIVTFIFTYKCNTDGIHLTILPARSTAIMMSSYSNYRKVFQIFRLNFKDAYVLVVM